MHKEKELIIFCDESDKFGKYYSKFYGGVLVGASKYQRISDELNALKDQLKLFGEIKWSKVTEQYLEKYEKIIHEFFKYIAKNHLKIRIMFTHNIHVPNNLTSEQREIEYFLLYYQFIKHAFGFRYVKPRKEGTRLRLFFDVFPDTSEKVEKFKGHLIALQKSEDFKSAKINIPKDEIAEVDSHKHVLLQCLDVILGSMSFRLNDKHKEKIPGSRLRGKRTIAKEKLYRFILSEIKKIHPNFNIGISTGFHGDLSNRWNYSYMHWLFLPRDRSEDFRYSKKKGLK